MRSLHFIPIFPWILLQLNTFAFHGAASHNGAWQKRHCKTVAAVTLL